MRFFLPLAACAFVAGLFASPCEAAWGVDGASAKSGSNNVQSVASVPDGAGGAFLVWEQDSQVWAQRFSALGVRQWGTSAVLVGTGHSPVSCSDGAGGLIVGFSTGSSGFSGSVFGVHLSPAGVQLWNTFVGSAGSTDHASLCSDGAGGAFFAWDVSFHVYAQHVASNGVCQWVNGGVHVSALSSDPVITSGQTGGAVLMWLDGRGPTGNAAIFAQRLTDPAGAPVWTANGVPVCNASGARSGIRLVPDGAGAFATWTDQRNVAVDQAFMQRVSGTDGASLWQTDGQLVATGGSGPTRLPVPVASGSGILVCWEDHRSGSGDIRAQRYAANGTAQWAQDVALSQATTDQTNPVAASDGSGGAVAGWQHWPGNSQTFGRAGRVSAAGALLWPLDGVPLQTSASMSPVTVGVIVGDGSGGAIAGLLGGGEGMPRAQRVLANSNLADFDAAITGATDLPGDEGGYVRLNVSAAAGDLAPGDTPVVGYNVWRRVAAAPAATLASARLEDPAVARARGLAALAAAKGARLDAAAAMSIGFPPGTWESLGMTGVLGLASYTIAAPTRADSTAAGSADETFVITVQTGFSTIWTATPAVVAHSVDNLAPTPPQNLAASPTAAHTITLSWNPDHEADLAWYAVYRGTSAGFVPSPGNRIATPTSPGYVDADYTAHFVYKVSAVDRHGNESSTTFLDPTSQVGVEDVAPVSFALGNVAPNPATTFTQFEWSLPRAMTARLEIFDVHGRRIRELFAGAQPAGTRRTRWDVRDATGALVPAGVYLARLEAGGERRERTLVVMP